MSHGRAVLCCASRCNIGGAGMHDSCAVHVRLSYEEAGGCQGVTEGGGTATFSGGAQAGVPRAVAEVSAQHRCWWWVERKVWVYKDGCHGPHVKFCFSLPAPHITALLEWCCGSIPHQGSIP